MPTTLASSFIILFRRRNVDLIDFLICTSMYAADGLLGGVYASQLRVTFIQNGLHICIHKNILTMSNVFIFS
jgi:hypothetical protein